MDNSWAAPGVWCECISNDAPDEPVLIDFVLRTGMKLPIIGQRYQVYDVRVHPSDGRVGIRLVGFPSVVVFDIRAFRPLSSKDEEMFREMLKDLPVEELSDA